MPRKRDPRRDKAFEIWKNSNGEKKLKDIAAELGVADTQIRKWKSQDKWSEKLKGNVTKSKRNVTNKKKKPKENVELKFLQSDELTDKQKLFCIHYVKTFNATQSAIKAGYSADTAHVQGSRLLSNVKVQEYIRELKANMTDTLFLDAMDVLRKYAAIAFADITDFVTFGKKEVQAMGAFGPLEDDDGNPIMKEVNYVDFKESTEIDGTIITEAKQGKDGVSIKLADKMKALEKLEKYFELIPDSWKQKIEEEKVKLQRDKFDFEKAKANIDDGNYEDDGFIEALERAAEVWNDEEGT